MLTGNSVHGGDVYSLAEEQRLSLDEIIDFSASINPLGPPKGAVEKARESLSLISHYPDNQCRKLKRVISEKLGIKTGMIICGNGSTELIYLLCRALRPSSALLPIPAFSEYERALRISNPSVEIEYLFLKEERAFELPLDELLERMKDKEVVFVCNPNNPTGRIVSQEQILRIASRAEKEGTLLVIDEAFVDFIPELSFVKHIERFQNVVLLRSLTKFYSLTGLRIGYGIMNEEIVERLNKYKEPWSINTVAIESATEALQDEEFERGTREFISFEREYLMQRLQALGAGVYPSYANFLLLKIPEATALYKDLLRKGIMVRDCSNFRGLDHQYIRVAIRRRDENDRLLKELLALR